MSDFFAYLMVLMVDLYFMECVRLGWEKNLFAFLAFLSVIMMTRGLLKAR